MKKANLLSKAEMKNVMGGNAVPVCNDQWMEECLMSTIIDADDETTFNIAFDILYRVCSESCINPL